MHPTWTPLDEIKLLGRKKPAAAVLTLARTLARSKCDPAELERLKQDTLRALDRRAKDYQALRATLAVLADLRRQGWEFRVRGPRVQVRRPERRAEALEEKQRVRAQHHGQRDQQLQKPSVVAFVQAMERGHVHQGRFVSIFSLMRDGRSLGEALHIARGLEGRERRQALRQQVRPYLQFVERGTTDDWTGFDLQDIWRYFRHTWTTPYHSLPGRSLQVLVRDAAAPNHPVIGIAALGSPTLQIRCREDWIGWTEKCVLSRLREDPSPAWGAWLRDSVEEKLATTYVADLLEDGLLTPATLAAPDLDVSRRLREESQRARRRHQALADVTDLKRLLSADDGDNPHWRKVANTHLYRSKRAALLAQLLSAKAAIDAHLERTPTAEQVRALLACPSGQRAVATVVRLHKADRVGVCLADIIVCGAVAPYNAILGGKLVSMLLASPEVARTYFGRFKDKPSKIASGMAARRVVKPPVLTYLGTTSLYGVGASQYNRISIPCERVGGQPGEELRYFRVGSTEGFGSGQFSDSTLRELADILNQRPEGRRVNFVFGEGQSPKLRMIREGLDHLGLPSDVILNHGSARIVYGVPLARNFRDYLLGLEDVPSYFLPQDDPEVGTGLIADHWRDRWLSNRILRDEVLHDVRRHTLVRPIRHGARVPSVSEPANELLLFDDLG